MYTNLFFDGSKGRLGIGTDHPAADIDVYKRTGQFGTVLVRVANIGPDGNAVVRAQNDAQTWDFGCIGANADKFVVSDVTAGGTAPFVIEPATPNNLLYLSPAGVAIGSLLTLKQCDLSAAMLELDTTIGEGNPVEALGTKTFTPTHVVKATLPGGLTGYLPFGTIG